MDLYTYLKALKMGRSGSLFEDLVAIKRKVGSIIKTEFAAIASFITKKAQKAISVDVQLEPIQDLHGYDTPWSGGNGKNKLNVENSTSTDFSRLGGTFTNNVTDTRTTGQIICQAYNGSTYVVSSSVFTENDGRYHAEITISDVITILRLKHNGLTKDFVIYFPWTMQGTFTVSCSLLKNDPTTVGGFVIADIMITTDGTYTPYSPYSNICPISGRTECVTNVVGKNLYSDVFSEYTKPVAYYIKPIPLEIGQTVKCTVTLKGTAMTGCVVAIAGSGETYPFGTMMSFVNTSGQIINQSAFELSDSWTDPKLAIYCSGEEQFNEIFANYQIQLEIGSTATDYEPYNGQSYTTDLGRTVYGGEVEQVGGSLTDKMGMVDLGDLNWARSTSFGGSFQATLTSMKENTAQSICSAYPSVSSGSEMTSADYAVYTKNNGKTVYAKDARYTDSASFKTAVSGVQLCYELATPQTYQLTPTEVALLKGNNNVWSNGGDISVTYVG